VIDAWRSIVIEKKNLQSMKKPIPKKNTTPKVLRN